MKLKLVNDNLINQKIASPIYNYNGSIIMNTGSVLTQRLISKIKEMGINTLYVQDENSELAMQEIISPITKIEMIRILKEEFDSIQRTKKVNDRIILYLVQKLMEEISESENSIMINNIANMGEKMDLVVHSINVAILSILVARGRKYNERKLQNLCIGALLHDVGKLFTEIKEKHPMEGYLIVRENDIFSPISTVAILQHHENVDGTGFPEKVKDDKISESAKIISICNEYERKVSLDENSFSYQIVEEIVAKTLTQFDSNILSTFVNSIYCYPNGLDVTLNNSSTGTVISQNKNFPTRPIIKIENSKQNIDLLKELSLFVEKVNL